MLRKSLTNESNWFVSMSSLLFLPFPAAGQIEIVTNPSGPSRHNEVAVLEATLTLPETVSKCLAALFITADGWSFVDFVYFAMFPSCRDQGRGARNPCRRTGRVGFFGTLRHP